MNQTNIPYPNIHQPNYIPFYYQPVTVVQDGLYDARWVWIPRTEKMKWELAESIDVDEIVRNGDINSLKFYLDSFVNANITEEDSKKFGSKGALNIFLLMQLGVDYLSTQFHNYTINYMNMKQYSQTTQINTNILYQQQQEIEKYKAMINEKDSTICQLKHQMGNLYEQQSDLKKEIKKLHQKIRNSEGFKEKTMRKTQKPRLRNTLSLEPGQMLSNHKQHSKPFNTTTLPTPIQRFPDNPHFDQSIEEGEIDVNGKTQNFGNN